MPRIDLHTHSIVSPDGSLTLVDYRVMLDSGRLDAVAITDHDQISFALEAHSKLGGRIIVGEEITAREGEIIGLFLSTLIPPGLSVAETVEQIHAQNGLVYMPHPFETVRKGLPRAVLDRIKDDIDIIEVFNGRAIFQNKSRQAWLWAAEHGIPGAASSDAHGRVGWGRTFSQLSEQPTAQNLPELLRCAKLGRHYVGSRGILYPKLNRMRKRLKHDQ